jgi:hypothetical protein
MIGGFFLALSAKQKGEDGKKPYAKKAKKL